MYNSKSYEKGHRGRPQRRQILAKLGPLCLFFVVSVSFLHVLYGVGFAQTFGQNKVNYQQFDWSYVRTKHFDVYFYTKEMSVIEQAEKILEDAYQSLKQDFGYDLRNRVPVIIYSSHNDFEQTNVILEVIAEETGGFTELFKNRIVVPFESSYEKFRHVLHHELTHAVMFDMIYGGLLESLLSRQYLLRLPLWFVEGLAEYESLGWETEADMVLRDAVISGYLPPLEQIQGGYLVYKGGQSILRYIAQEYGGEKIGEILTSVKRTRSIDKSLRLSLGLDVKELSKKWQNSLKREYWPEIGKRQRAEDFAKRLTEHKKDGSYLNATPAFSPYADKIAFLSDRSDYKDIYLMSAIDGAIIKRLVKGEKSAAFEEMHWLRGGITWSPDGSRIAFTARSRAKDALYVRDVKEGTNKGEYKFDLDGMFSPTWSPDGKRIAFIGLAGGASNIYSVDLEDGTLSQLTDDACDEADPEWTPDWNIIAFSSDRRISPTNPDSVLPGGDYNIYVMDLEGHKVTQITSNPFNDLSPTWSPDGSKTAFSSDRNGIYNIYVTDISPPQHAAEIRDSLKAVPITDALTGCFDPSWSPDGKKIAFTSFQEGGWDIFVMEQPFAEVKEELEPTQFRSGEKTPQAAQLDTAKTTPPPDTTLARAQKYEPRFSPDLIYATVGYSSYWGFEGETLIVVSDILGDHRIYFYGDLFYSIENSNIQFAYYYLKRRTDYGAAFFNFREPYWTKEHGWFFDSIYGAAFLLSRPFSRFTRLDAEVISFAVDREYYRWEGYYRWRSQDRRGMRALLLNCSLVNDTVVWGVTGPVNGSRSIFSVQHSVDLGKDSPSFTTLSLDFRKYIRLQKKYTFAARLSGGASTGENPQRFFVGGIENWLNPEHTPGRIESIEDFYLADLATPLRGTRYYELSGTGYLLLNLEFRYPFIEYLTLGWPLPVTLRNVRGVIFTDVGSAGDLEEISSFNNLASYGVGARVNLGIAILRVDTAWRWPSGRARYCFSLGAEF